MIQGLFACAKNRSKRALLSIKVVEQKDVTGWCEKNPETDLWEIFNISEIN